MSGEVSVTITRDTAKALLILVVIVFVAGAIAQGFDYEASYWIFPYSLIGKLAAFFGWFAGSVLLWLEAKRRLGL